MDFGHHQPVCWRFGWVEERVGLPDILNVVDSQSGVFEQVGCLPVDLERVVVVELIEIEQLSRQSDCNTNGYRMTDTPPHCMVEVGMVSWPSRARDGCRSAARSDVRCLEQLFAGGVGSLLVGRSGRTQPVQRPLISPP